MDKTIVVIAEYFQSKIAPVTFELLACALDLQEHSRFPIKMMIMGKDAEGPAGQLVEITGLDVTAVTGENLPAYNAELYKAVLGDMLPALNPAYVLIAHTTQGWDFAPGLAIRLKAACVTGVEHFFTQEGRPCFTRSICNGKVVVDVSPLAETTVLTVQPGYWKAASFTPEKGGQVDVQTVSREPQRSHSLEIIRAKEESSALSEADVVVSAGRGVGKKENLELIERLAALFPKSAVGGSRPVCDSGWLEYKRQVGLTGATVAPKLYIACGISGSVQHRAGMEQSAKIVAINRDPDAPIFSIAHYGIIGDLNEVVPMLIDDIKKRRVD